jgi:DNA repair exonuclease SbcCD ATPase subunit
MAAKLMKERDTEDIDALTSELSDIETKVFSLTSAIEAIKSGAVHKSYLHTFTSVLNSNLGKLKQDLNISMRVLSKIDNNGLSFSVLDDGVYKFSDVLSAGEKVIAGLMVLTAMFETLGDTLDIRVNIVMLDEAVSAVSQQNMRVVESLLKNLTEGRTVIVTQHHDELPEEIFKEVKHISKADGITQID